MSLHVFPAVGEDGKPYSVKKPFFAHIHIESNLSKPGYTVSGPLIEDVEQQAKCMLLAKVLSLNSMFFDFPKSRYNQQVDAKDKS